MGLLEEAAVAIKEFGIYVLVTKELTVDSRKTLEQFGVKVGLEWQFELDGISDDGPGCLGGPSILYRSNARSLASFSVSTLKIMMLVEIRKPIKYRLKSNNLSPECIYIQKIEDPRFHCSLMYVVKHHMELKRMETKNSTEL